MLDFLSDNILHRNKEIKNLKSDYKGRYDIFYCLLFCQYSFFIDNFEYMHRVPNFVISYHDYSTSEGLY